MCGWKISDSYLIPGIITIMMIIYQKWENCCTLLQTREVWISVILCVSLPTPFFFTLTSFLGFLVKIDTLCGEGILGMKEPSPCKEWMFQIRNTEHPEHPSNIFKALFVIGFLWRQLPTTAGIEGLTWLLIAMAEIWLAQTIFNKPSPGHLGIVNWIFTTSPQMVGMDPQVTNSLLNNMEIC